MTPPDAHPERLCPGCEQPIRRDQKEDLCPSCRMRRIESRRRRGHNEGGAICLTCGAAMPTRTGFQDYDGPTCAKCAKPPPSPTPADQGPAPDTTPKEDRR